MSVVALPAVTAPTGENTSAWRPAPDLPSHEELSRLARDDPEAYEALRRKVVDEFIERAPERLKSRLCGIQFQVDSVRRLSRSSALGATVRVYQLMWKSFQQLNEVWQDFVPLEKGFVDRRSSSMTVRYAPKQDAKIIAFRPRHSVTE